MLDQDKVLQNFKIALVVIALILIVSGFSHRGESAAKSAPQTAKEEMEDMAKSGGL